MSEKPTKPRRDLRARLGKTITPKTAGADGAPAPEVGGAAAPAAPVVKPPAAVAGPPAGIAAPPFAATPDVAPPPFAAPAAQPEAPADPFGATAAAPQQQVVRLEFDDKLVTDQETGKSGKAFMIVAALASLVVGAGIGWAIASNRVDNQLFERTMSDGQAIHAKVTEASQTLEQAQQKLNAIVAAAAGNAQAGEAPRVDYESIEALRALQKPITWTDFTNKNYNAYTATVHDLMQYAQNIERIWTEIGALAVETLPEARRAELNRTAEATGEGASTNYGAVLVRNEDGLLVGQLAFLGDGSAQGKVLARPTRGGPGREFSIFHDPANQEITSSPEYVALIDGAGSRGVLAEQTGAFGRYLQSIAELKRLIDATVEIQGRVLNSIATVLNEAGVPLRASN